MSILIGCLQLSLLALVLRSAHKYSDDRPFASLLSYVVVTDGLRYVLLAFLPHVQDFPGQLTLFWILDVLWLSWYIAHWAVSLSYTNRRWYIPAGLMLFVVTGVSGLFAWQHLETWRHLRLYSPRWIWLRCAGIFAMVLAWREMFAYLYSGKKCRGAGLVLASTLAGIIQLLQWDTEEAFPLYRMGLITYLVVGIVVYTHNIFKEKNHG